MKRCPSCEFTFADSHRVCDFDGSELVDVPERPPSLPKTRYSRLWRVLKSPLFLAGSGLLFVLMSALLVAYYDATNQLNPVAQNQPAQNSSEPPANSAQAEIKTPVVINSKRKEQSSLIARRQPTGPRVFQRTSTLSSARNRRSKSAAEVQKEAKETSHRKDPKLVAMLKTTWNVLKKPFKF